MKNIRQYTAEKESLDLDQVGPRPAMRALNYQSSRFVTKHMDDPKVTVGMEKGDDELMIKLPIRYLKARR